MEFRKPTIVYSIRNKELFLMESEFIWEDDKDGYWIVKIEGNDLETLLTLSQFVTFSKIYDILFVCNFKM